MSTYRNGYVSINLHNSPIFFPAQILIGSEVKRRRTVTVQARFTWETVLQIVDAGNADWPHSFTINYDNDTVSFDFDGSTGTVGPDSEGMYSLNPWNWEEAHAYVLTAVLVMPAKDTDVLGHYIVEALQNSEAKLIPCSWQPELDPIADAASLPYGSITLADCNAGVNHVYH